MKLISWNVNGIRAVHNKSVLLPLIEKENPDIFCVQETKAQEDTFPEELKNIKGYNFYISSAVKKGYSGTALWSRQPAISVKYGFGKPHFDDEGRTIIAEFDTFFLYNIYFPNGGRGPEFVEKKLAFYEEFLKNAEKDRKKKDIIICGDVNTAHKEIDLARPKENRKVSGFLPEECAFLDKLVSKGYLDTFRMFNKDGNNYSWWDYKSGARQRNIGWRIDYFYVNEELKSKVKSAGILSEVMGSDHAPVVLEIK